ncbi:MAG TPA: hypothetical protein VLH09_03140, partial [Bryobacteraceae bacterium]|nr:hypothetical protein [Bryobacteraceae bacterium]
LVHVLGPAHLALQLGLVSPVSVECVSKEPLNRWVWPWRAHTVFEFPALAGMPPGAARAGEWIGVRRLEGLDGHGVARRRGLAASRVPVGRLQAPAADDPSRGQSPAGLDTRLQGGTPGVSQFSIASKYIEWLALGTVAQHVPGKLLWDARNMRFSNSQEANKYVKPFARKGWEMKLWPRRWILEQWIRHRRRNAQW